jgi:hypothetical protein
MSASLILDTVIGTAVGVVGAVLPLLVILTIFQVLFLKMPVAFLVNLLKGILLCVVGLWLFLLGVQIGFLPYGQAIGEALGRLEYQWLPVPVGLVLGFITAWSEPAVRVLCSQVEKASSGTIRSSVVLYSISIGVAVFVALGMTRIIYGIPLLYILVPGYSLAILMLWFTRREFIGVAFDAGGVATGPIANTFLLGVGLGLASAMGGQDMLVNGLGLVSLIALAPIISVMALGIIIRYRMR